MAGFASAGATLQEMFAAPGDVAAMGFVLSLLRPSGGREAMPAPLLWVQDRKTIREMGRVFLHGLSQDPDTQVRQDIVHVAAKDGKEALWAMAEGLKCTSLGAVIGEVHGDPRALDFTATRRLAVAAERYGVPAFLLRVSGNADLSGARRRWRVESRPSLPHPHDDKAPGAPVWSLDLFRARDMQPRVWVASYDRAALRPQDRLDMVSDAGDGQMAEQRRQTG
ncbi:MAG: hypothetical protein WA954_05795 [Parerythrobacter sp.]